MKIFSFYIPLFCAFYSTATIAQPKEMSILNGRFYCSFPDSAKNIARGSLMGPRPNEIEETRIILDEGKKRLVFFATEQHRKTSVDIEEKISENNIASNSFISQPIYRKKSAAAFVITPNSIDSSNKEILINSLLVQNADGTLSRLDAYIGPKDIDNLIHFRQITQDVFASFRPGSRKLNLVPHYESFTIMGSGFKLRIKLPQNYTVVKENGIDFEVCKLEKVTDFSASDTASLLIYFGYHPPDDAAHFSMENLRQADADQELIHRTSAWNNYFDPTRSFYLREQSFDENEIGEGIKMHVAIATNQKQLLEEMSAIVKDLSIIYKKSPDKDK